MKSLIALPVAGLALFVTASLISKYSLARKPRRKSEAVALGGRVFVGSSGGSYLSGSLVVRPLLLRPVAAGAAGAAVAITTQWKSTCLELQVLRNIEIALTD